MLLRSSSTPIFNSCFLHSKDSSPEPEFQFLQRAISVSFASSFRSVSSFDDSASKKLINSSHVKLPPHNSCKQQCKTEITDEKEEQEETKPRSRIQTLFSSSGLGDIAVSDSEKELVAGGGIGGVRGGGGRRYDGDGDNDNDGSGFYSSTGAYYEKMISADPGNPLLLGNYAKFLKEVRKDYEKAEEYYERAILANPNDGNILSLYADLIWEKDKDSQRAENYFGQAVKTAPEDSYVLASYARFLWDAEEEEDDENEGGKNEAKSPARFLNGHSIAAAS